MPKKLPKWVHTLLVILIVVVGIKVVWDMAFPSGTWRYKLTVEVDTPEGFKTGSAVREVEGYYFPRLLGAMAAVHRKLAKGEAVVVDLGARGKVYALNNTYKHGSSGAWAIVGAAFPKPFTTEPDIIRHYRSLDAGPVELEPGNYPMLVRFRDPMDPKTVENLLSLDRCPNTQRRKPQYCVTEDRFAEAFGEGVSLKSVTIEMTREPVTTGVVGKYMPSYKKDYEGFMEWFRSLPYGDPRKIGPDAFGSWGEK